MRYAIKQGRLKAVKKTGRWFIPEEALPKAPEQKKVAKQQKARHEHRVDKAFAVKADGEGKGYSVKDLRAYQNALPVAKEVRDLLGAEHPASEYLETALELRAFWPKA